MAKKIETAEYIQKAAKQTFNEAWNYLEKKKLTKAEKTTLLNLTHASFYFWQQVPEHTPTNTSIGLWQISRAYAHTGDGNNALLYAELNMQLVKKNELDGFFVAYAHESMARAFSLLKEKEKSEKYLKSALKAIKLSNEKHHIDEFFADIEELEKLNADL